MRIVTCFVKGRIPGRECYGRTTEHHVIARQRLRNFFGLPRRGPGSSPAWFARILEDRRNICDSCWGCHLGLIETGNPAAQVRPEDLPAGFWDFVGEHGLQGQPAAASLGGRMNFIHTIDRQRIPAAATRTTRIRGCPGDGSPPMSRHVSPITQPGYGKGRPSKNKGRRFAVDILTPEEIEALKDGCNVGIMGLRNRGVMDCLHGTGVRVGEFCNIKLRDIDRETRAFRIYGTKTRNADRSVGCNEDAFASIRDWLDIRATLDLPGPYAFPCLSKHERGNPIKPAQLRQMIHNLAAKAGLEGPHTDRRVHPHCFRHSFAAELWREKVDLQLISKALGHSSIAVTQIYINHVAPFEVIEATANRTFLVAA